MYRHTEEHTTRKIGQDKVFSGKESSEEQGEIVPRYDNCVAFHDLLYQLFYSFHLFTSVVFVLYGAEYSQS